VPSVFAKQPKGYPVKDDTIDVPGLDGIVIGPVHVETPTGLAAINAKSCDRTCPWSIAFASLSSGFQVTHSGNKW
jgi:hypothetical protein